MTAVATAPRSGVSFGGILKSEWIKLFSLRSTYWCYAILVFLTLSLGRLFGSVITVEGRPLDSNSTQAFAVQGATLSIGMSQLVIAVLGALVIAIGEQLATQYLGANWVVVVPFLVIFLILLIRPQGILGQKIREDAVS